MNLRSLSALALLTICAVPLHADPASDAHKSIQAMYDKRDAALARFDLEGYLAVYNGNYQNMTGGAPKKTDQQRQAVIRQYQRADKISRQETVQSVTMVGHDAMAMVGSVTHLYGHDPKTHAAFSSVIRETDRAFWVSTRAGWRLKQERRMADMKPTL